MKLSAMKLNLSAIDEGTWVDDIPDLPGVAFCVRGSEYVPYKQAMSRFHTASVVKGTRRDKIAQLRSAADVDVDKFTDFMSTQIAEHLLVGWSGVDDDVGNEIPLTKALAIEALTNRAYAPLKRGIMFAIEVVDAGLVEHREEASGNS